MLDAARNPNGFAIATNERADQPLPDITLYDFIWPDRRDTP